MIKTFESFHSDEYYTQITIEEYRAYINNYINIDSSLIQRIKDNSKVKIDVIRLIERFNIHAHRNKDIKKGIYLSYRIRISGEMPPGHYEYYLEREYEIWIYELADEWFIVNYKGYNISGSKFWNNKYKVDNCYKCDQVSGLIKLFQELNILN